MTQMEFSDTENDNSNCDNNDMYVSFSIDFPNLSRNTQLCYAIQSIIYTIITITILFIFVVTCIIFPYSNSIIANYHFYVVVPNIIGFAMLLMIMSIIYQCIVIKYPQYSNTIEII